MVNSYTVGNGTIYIRTLGWNDFPNFYDLKKWTHCCRSSIFMSSIPKYSQISPQACVQGALTAS